MQQSPGLCFLILEPSSPALFRPELWNPNPLRHPDQSVEQTATGCPVVNPSPVPTEGTSLGCASHIGQSLLRTVEERIQIIKFILSPVWIGKAPCMC